MNLPSDRHSIRVITFDDDGMEEHDLGIVRIKEGEVGMLFFDADGEPFVSVMPQCEAKA